MINLGSIMMGTEDFNAMAEFYEALFEKAPDMKEEDFVGWASGGSFLSIGKHSEVHGKAKEPQRLLINFETKEVKEQFERISKIPGAEVVKEPYELGGAWIATIADPDGNYFQLMTPWEG